MTMTMTMMMGVVDRPTYLSYLRYLPIRSTATTTLLPNQLNGISVAILDELEILVISWKGEMEWICTNRQEGEGEEEE